ncbi:hypothetical protein [Sphingobacterium bovistauri]|uniref:O-Antigen ligase n=1 Tax=Sphingobacterium bovistauri TaxID=2781959 RepID=A0ABS7Z5C5_9SPHI|nr:hypothetical protein [Sphingobacterium bovistauri]MCA5004090.1 hypothetical protein [Sphingobacterium bovistauri]
MWSKIKEHKFSIFFQLSVIVAMLSVNRMLFYIPFFWGVSYIFFKNIKELKKADKLQRTFMFFLLQAMIFGLVINVFWEPSVLFHFIISLVTFTSAFLLTRNVEDYYIASKYCLVFYQVSFILVALSQGFNNFPIEVPFEEIIPGGSANGITSFAVLLQINFTIVSLLVKNESTVRTSLLTLVIALIGFGRGSIVSSFLLVIISVFISLGLQKKFKAIGITIFLIITTSWILTSYFEQVTYFIESKTKLSQGMVDQARSDMINVYLSRMDFPAIFIGADYDNSVIETKYGGNPHNSFIRAHHIFGLFYLAFITIIPLFLVLKIKENWKKLILWMLFGILFFRVFSEPLIWPTVFDFYYFSICIIMMRMKRTRYHYLIK